MSAFSNVCIRISFELALKHSKNLKVASPTIFYKIRPAKIGWFVIFHTSFNKSIPNLDELCNIVRVWFKFSETSRATIARNAAVDAFCALMDNFSEKILHTHIVSNQSLLLGVTYLNGSRSKIIAVFFTTRHQEGPARYKGRAGQKSMQRQFRWPVVAAPSRQ
jgi:hypothetical protein